MALYESKLITLILMNMQQAYFLYLLSFTLTFKFEPSKTWKRGQNLRLKLFYIGAIEMAQEFEALVLSDNWGSIPGNSQLSPIILVTRDQTYSPDL